MKKPMKAAKAAGGPTTKEKDGKTKKTGVNTPMKKESIPQVVARTTYGQPTSTQKR